MIYSPFILTVLISYLIGSISFAVMVAKRHGVDILSAGSGNPGATNVKRVLGARQGNLVFFLDFMKGFISVAYPYFLFPQFQYLEFLPILSLMCAIVGHSYSIFLKFKGGKGVATSIGGLILIMPLCLLISLILWFIVYKRTNIVSIASIVLGVSLPVIAYIVGYSDIKFYFAIFIMFIILIRHRMNIFLLLAGKENKFKK